MSLDLTGLIRKLKERVLGKLRTCNRTLALSTGAVMRVVGTAERKPAVASSEMDKVLIVRSGVSEKMIFLDKS